MRRVVVTGIGAVTPIGNSFEESWNSLLKGISGISMIERSDIYDLPYKYAGQIKGLNVDDNLTSKERIRYDLFVHYAFLSAKQAIENADLLEFINNGQGSDISVVIGSSRAGILSLDRAIRKQCIESPNHRLPKRRISPYLMPSTSTNMAASFIAQKYGLIGECIGVSNVCTSGIAAIGTAFRLIKHGISDIVIAGGADAPLTRICFEGYGASGVLSRINSTNASRPFDSSRDGFVLSEGGCILILEDYENARRRGVRIYGEVKGYANGMDAYHQTTPSSEGEARTIAKALKNSGIDNETVGFISAHAASTRIGDCVEAKALKTVFGSQVACLPVSAFKSMTGHMLAASGAFEAASSLSALNKGVIPPTINLKEKDPACDLDIVTSKREIDADYAMVDSFGFGGVNAVLVLKKTS